MKHPTKGNSTEGIPTMGVTGSTGVGIHIRQPQNKGGLVYQPKYTSNLPSPLKVGPKRCPIVRSDWSKKFSVVICVCVKIGVSQNGWIVLVPVKPT